MLLVAMVLLAVLAAVSLASLGMLVLREILSTDEEESSRMS